MNHKVTPQRKSVKEVLKTNKDNLKSGVLTLASKVKSNKKPAKKLTKAQKIQRNTDRKHVIIGIGLLLVAVSIYYSTSVTSSLVDSKAVYVALAPQVAFAVIVTIKAFSKIYK